jgi:hypothetical protein
MLTAAASPQHMLTVLLLLLDLMLQCCSCRFMLDACMLLIVLRCWLHCRLLLLHRLLHPA